MKENDFDWKDYHHTIYQIYHGMIALTLVPFALLLLEWDSKAEAGQVFHQSPLFILTLQLLWLIGFASWYVWKGEKVMYEVSEGDELIDKLAEFKKKNVRKYLILAVAGIVAAFAMWIQPSIIFAIAYLAVLVQYSFLRPSEDKIVRDMQLSKQDRNLLRGIE